MKKRLGDSFSKWMKANVHQTPISGTCGKLLQIEWHTLIYQNHLNRFDPIHPPHCRNCTHPYETTEHILFECLGLKKDREELLPPLPTIGNCLYSSTSQLRNTAKLYYMSLSSKSWLTQKCLLIIIIIIIIRNVGWDEVWDDSTLRTIIFLNKN